LEGLIVQLGGCSNVVGPMQHGVLYVLFNID
jgi:hypothetical protein